MNELTEFGPENNALARRWGAQSPLVHTMASDAFPVIGADFRSMDEELIALRGDALRAGAFGLAAAAVGNFSAVGVANPSDSGVIGIVELLKVRSGAAIQIQVRRQAAAVSALGGAVLGVPLDSRQGESASIRLVLTNEAAVANYGTLIHTLQLVANVDEIATIPFVLAPLSTLWLVGATANTGVAVNASWRQRRIASWEARGVGS